MKNQKRLALILSVVLCVSALSSCTGGNSEQEGKINIKIADWPDETDPSGHELYEGYRSEMNKLYPDVNVIPDKTTYADAKIFQMKAAANQLPTMYTTHFTEIQQTIKSGYAADITNVVKERGFTDAINPRLLDFLKGEDGNIYAFPMSAYLQGLTLNKELFTKAGLVHEDGSVMIPDTYQELAEYARIIKEKTGVAGYAICTANNCGGWHFMNIAWSYGVNFMQQREDGTWEAVFNTQEARDALQFVKDLKWKYDVLPDETVIDQSEIRKLFGVNQAAMIFEGPTRDYTYKYGMDASNIVFGKMPEGPKGRYVQMGGTVKMFAPNATENEINACFDWLKVTGIKVELDDEALQKSIEGWEHTIEQNGIILAGAGTAIPLWTDKDRLAKEAEAKKDYVNIPLENCQSYYDTSDCTIMPEEPVLCQQLYSVLDGCVQEVIVNENADVALLIENACNDFQVNHLDKLGY